MSAPYDHTPYERQMMGEKPDLGTPNPQPGRETSSVVTVPKNMDRLVTAVLDQDWTPDLKAQMIGAAFLEADEQRAVADQVMARDRAGAVGTDAAMEAAVQIEMHSLEVRAEAERRIMANVFPGSEELSWDDLSDAQKEFIIPGLLTAGGVCVICARSNLGKTFTYISMVCSMATGLPWLGKPTRQAKTLVVIGEGKAGFMGRLRGWMTANGKTEQDLRPWLFFVDRANLNNDESLRRIREIVERETIEVVVYDTWAATSGIVREDDAALTGQTISRVKDAMPDQTHLFIHHPRKAEQDTDAPVMRGSGAFEAAADIVMMMYRDRKFIPATGEQRDFIALSTEQDHNGKAREAQTETIRGLYLAEVELPNGEVSRVLRLLESETISKESREVRKFLTRDMSAAEFCGVYPKSRATAYRHLNRAVEEGVAERRSGPLGIELFHPSQLWSTLLEVAS